MGDSRGVDMVVGTKRWLVFFVCGVFEPILAGLRTCLGPDFHNDA